MGDVIKGPWKLSKYKLAKIKRQSKMWVIVRNDVPKDTVVKCDLVCKLMDSIRLEKDRALEEGVFNAG